MANPEHVAKLEEGVEAWNQWRADQAITPDMGGADFSRKDLSRANFRGVNFRESTLRESNLQGADLRGTDLRGVNFSESNLTGTSLREANLQGVDLSVAKRGLQTEQLAGADLTGATLPEELKKLYDGLQNVNNISESTRKLFLAVLAACLYSWLTIATTTDLNLITNRASSPLPIIQTSIPIVGFYVVAPLLLLCVYFYFHFYLQKLWEELGSLPAILPDGRPLHAKIDPWLLNDLVRSHLPKLDVNRPFLSYFQLWISVLLAWWVVPMTMFLFWGRYLPRQDRTGTTFHVALLAISLAAALRLYRLAAATLRGAWRGPFRWKSMSANRRGYQTAALAVAVGVLFGIVSWGARWGTPSDAPILGIPLLLQRGDVGAAPVAAKGPLTWVPRLMALVGYSPFANLTSAEISQKKPTWSKNDKNLDSVSEAELKEANLRYALARGAFLAGADLAGADLRGADLRGACLQGAGLKGADMNADLGGADLRGAVLSDAKLAGANLTRALLRGVDLRDVDLSGAKLFEADLQGARLSRSVLRGAELTGADLQGADLSYADLSNALLFEANLRDSRLIFADLGGANLSLSELTYSNIRAAKNLNLETVKDAHHWEKAFYDDEMLKALGLPPDHNQKLAEQQKADVELQQKQDSGQTAPKPTSSKQ